MDFTDTLIMIAKELPEGFRISIDAEQGYAGVVLITPDGDEVECIDIDLSMLNRVNFLITVAKDWKDDNTTLFEDEIIINGLQ